MQLALIKYNAGNIRSVMFALGRLGIEPDLTDDPEVIRKADKVIFPGVGEASTAMAYLKERKLDTLIPSLQQPVLGICLGQQLMCKHSEENDTSCFGIFDLKVKKFQGKEKIPQIGWNTIYNLQGPLFKGIPEHAYVYFVHSYYAEMEAGTIATGNYMNDFSAALHKDNFYAVQFHPEKSGEIGQRILNNFLKI